MKKLLFLLCFTTILSCSKSDDDSNNSSANTSINPPSWIIGKWINNSGISSLGYVFKNNDFGTSVLNSDIWVKPTIDLYNSGKQGTATVIEEKTDSYYKVSYTIGSTALHYHFVKISNTQIKEILSDPNGVLIYTKQ